MPIHTIGDSHSHNGWPGIINHHVGPVLCYSFGTKKDLFDICEFDIKDDDSIVFSFGEIDCRCHINKHINEEQTYQDIIDDIVDKYFVEIKNHISNLTVKLKYICVYNIVPPVKTTDEDIEDDPRFPFLGSDEERKNYVLYFNKKLKEKCIDNDYVFFDIYDKYLDENGFLNKELKDQHVHIKDGIHIENFIIENDIGTIGR